MSKTIDGTVAPLEEGEPNPWLGGRGTRLTPAQKRRIKEYCLKRDGPKCMICGRDEMADPRTNLEIDHKDDNASNHFASNLQLAHHVCNSRRWNRDFRNKQISDQPKREIGLLAPQLELSPTSPEVKLNREYEPIFRRYCFEELKKYKKEGCALTKTELRIRAREYTGCSLQTSYSYIERLFASNGPFTVREDLCVGIIYVDFRDYKDINLNVEKLEIKYPKEGQRVSKVVEMC